MKPVALFFSLGVRSAHVRDITGADEMTVCGTDTLSAVRLLERLVTGSKKTNGNGSTPEILDARSVVDLAGPDRDRLLAAVYTTAYGDTVSSTLNCGECEEPFDVTFELEDLLANTLDAAKAGDPNRGEYSLKDGTRFRLPTARDEYAVVGLSDADARRGLLGRCLLDKTSTIKNESLAVALEDAMEEVGPMLSLDIDAECPECNQRQSAEFDIQHYLLHSLLQERPQIVREIHCLASAYRWSHEEIVNLPRAERRELVDLVESEWRAAEAL